MEVPGRAYPVEVVYRPANSMFEKSWEAAVRLSQEALGEIKKQGEGTVLCFLPGYWEMQRAQEFRQPLQIAIVGRSGVDRARRPAQGRERNEGQR